MPQLIFLIVVYALGIYLGFKFGYEKREKEFQDRPVNFIVGKGYPVLRVRHNDEGKVDVRIFDEKFINIIK